MGTAWVYQLVGERREGKAQLLSLVWKMNIGTILRYSVSSILKKINLFITTVDKVEGVCCQVGFGKP